MILDALSTSQKQELVDAFYWYHTVDLGHGVTSRGTVDHAAVFHRYGFPSLVGRSVLDVGAGDGYFSFQFERLGARDVLAIDVDRWKDEPEFDAPARTRMRRLQKYRPRAGEEARYADRERIARELGFDRPDPFYLARALLGSGVRRAYATVYELQTWAESFDMVFLGTVTTHLQDLPRAFEAVRAVTRQQAVVACAGLLDMQGPRGWSWTFFQAIRLFRWLGRLEGHVVVAREAPVARYTANEGGAIWRPSVMCIQEMLLSAGFRDVAVFSRFPLTNLRHGTGMDHVIFHAYV